MDTLLLAIIAGLVLTILLQAAWMDGARATALPNGNSESGFADVFVMLGILAMLSMLVYMVFG